MGLFTVLGIHLYEERNTFIAENYFIRSIVFKYVTFHSSMEVNECKLTGPFGPSNVIL
ncbi:MAG TPA: hypothetical protein VE307_05880 [Nitrososphaeraceae archaeon]|nr:hypothetical protein [Nitrososphaeraceae archaeon]